jgi:hypothetical protein
LGRYVEGFRQKLPDNPELENNWRKVVSNKFQFAEEIIMLK